MRRTTLTSTAGFIGTLCLLVLMIPDTAHAYLDPGTGSAILQGVLVVLAAFIIVLRQYWHRLLSLLGSRKKSKGAERDNEDADTNI